MLSKLSPTIITAILDALPLDITFIDDKDTVRYFNANRIFQRPPECLDRDVRECHQPASHPAIDRMIEDFKSGRRDKEQHVVRKTDGRVIKVVYSALRDESGVYLGLLETAEVITPGGSGADASR